MRRRIAPPTPWRRRRTAAPRGRATGWRASAKSAGAWRPLVGHLRRASIERVVEIWLRAQPEVVGARYAERAGRRGDAHPGFEYAPELEELARRAKPLGGFPLIEVDAASAYDADALAVEARWLLGAS